MADEKCGIIFSLTPPWLRDQEIENLECSINVLEKENEELKRRVVELHEWLGWNTKK